MVAAGDRPARDGQQGQPARRFASSVPQGLRPHEYFYGTPWWGESGITESVREIMTRGRGESAYVGPERVSGRPGEGEGAAEPKAMDANAPLVAQWPLSPETAVATGTGHLAAVTLSTTWLGPRVSESGYVPPDSNGAVGPTQVLVTANGRFKLYDKTGALLGLNVSDGTFFASVTSGAGVSDPHVRYDRLSGRWFISDITTTATSNRILIAVSSGSTITDSSSFTFFQFQHDLVGTTPNADTGGFADYDTLGVDANALYIGINEFNPSFSGTSGYVVNKDNLLGGSLNVTAFRQLSPASGAGVYTPQGVDNDDPNATEGYFIGVDNASYSKLQIRRVTNPGGSPGISGNLSLAVPATYAPVNQVAQGTTGINGAGTGTLDALDDRLFAAMIRKNLLTGVGSLWTAHNIRVNSSGVASSSGDRNGSRWYQIDNLTTTPTLTQSGTVFDSSASNPIGYWIPSVAANGQGHMALGSSYAGAVNYAGAFVTGRLSSDALGATQAGTMIASTTSYNLQFTTASNKRWGDYSQVVVDPSDDQTMWTFQEVCDAANSWSVRAIKLLAPPPATPSSASPSSVALGVGSANITVTGTSSAGSGFFDPGSGFANHLAASVTGGVVVNSVTFASTTSVTLNVSTVGASSGAQTVTITNPDGQQAAGAILTVGSAAAFVQPAQGATITESAVTFSWTAGTGVSQYQLYVGSSPGANDYARILPGAATSATATGLPLNGQSVYARLWSLASGAWISTDLSLATINASGAAVLSSPAQGVALTESAVAFSWAAAAGATQYWLYLGSSVGANDFGRLYAGGNLSVTATNLPTDGSTVYARLWSLLSSGWVFTDTTFATVNAGGGAVLSSPAQGTAFTEAAAVFTWNTASGALQYQIYVGSSIGANDYAQVNAGTNLSTTISGLPTAGQTLYVRIWTLLSTGWTATDTSLTSTNAGGGAALSSPAQGSSITEASVNFGWAAASGASQYLLYVGSATGMADYALVMAGASTTATATGLPTDGRTIYVRVWALVASGWVATDTAFAAANGAGGGVLSSPAQGTTIGGSSATFTWTAGTATQYYLYLGSSPGSSDYGLVSTGASRQATVTGLPTDGRTIHVRVWSLVGAMWVATDCTLNSG